MKKISLSEEELKKKALHLQLEYERKLSQVEDATKRLKAIFTISIIALGRLSSPKRTGANENSRTGKAKERP